MYLIRIHLNPLRRDTVRAFSNPNLIHGAICQTQVDRTERVLWRIDTLGQQTYLMILSPTLLETKEIINQFGYPQEVAQVKDYNLLLDRIHDGSRWAFRLCANSTVSGPACDGQRGKIHAHVSSKWQMEWLKNKSVKNGFSIDLNQTKVVYSKWIQFRKHSPGMVSIKEVIFEGVLTVDNSELFKKALVHGIGKGKAYGMGMLTVVACYE